MAAQDRFPGPVVTFGDRRLPEPATPAGYSALIDGYDLAVPLPRLLFATGERHRTTSQDGWRIMSPRHAPRPTLESHLTFALKYEGIDLAVLKRLFRTAGPAAIAALVLGKPAGAYTRRIWFLYEWLTDERLDLADATAGRYVPVIDPAQQLAIEGEPRARYRVRDNLPGTPAFCPLVFRTAALERLIAADLPRRAREVVGNVPRDLLARAAAFLLLEDSRSSYAIEGEHPPQNRIQRWGAAIGQAGRHPLDPDELLRLQRIVLGDTRFVKLGFREEGGFVGEHDRRTRMPLPSHISAKPVDLPSLIDGLVAFERGPAQKLDPVVAAAILAFGFVYVHPFEDGNGRVHRYLMHHVLARRGFNPAGIVFPVSSAILAAIDSYREVLESHSRQILPLIEWEPTSRFNIDVSNETDDLYRFFDATLHAEFLLGCVQKTIEQDLPAETAFLQRYDRFRREIEAFLEMPSRSIDLLFRFLGQNDGKLSERARSREFGSLSAAEADRIEAAFRAAFHEPREAPDRPPPSR